MSNPADKPLDGMGLAVVNQIIDERLAKKQDKISGQPGQVAGFDAAGQLTAQDMRQGSAAGESFQKILTRGLI